MQPIRLGRAVVAFTILNNYSGDLFAGINDATGGMRGNWLAVGATVILLVVNVLGEELYPAARLPLGRDCSVVHSCHRRRARLRERRDSRKNAVARTATIRSETD